MSAHYLTWHLYFHHAYFLRQPHFRSALDRQERFGAPSRSGYHNREWGARMETLGLIPSDTGRPGGKRTGQIMGHYVSDGGPFEQAAKSLRGAGWQVPVVALLERPRPVSKLKYTCLGCGINVWGRAGLAVDCANCGLRMLEVG